MMNLTPNTNMKGKAKGLGKGKGQPTRTAPIPDWMQQNTPTQPN